MKPILPLSVAVVEPNAAHAVRLRSLLTDGEYRVAAFEAADALLDALRQGARFEVALVAAAAPGARDLCADLEPAAGPEAPVFVSMGAEPVTPIHLDLPVQGSVLRSTIELAAEVWRKVQSDQRHSRRSDELANLLDHDLRNPLTAALRLAERLSHVELLSSHGRADLEALIRSARKALRRLEAARSTELTLSRGGLRRRDIGLIEPVETAMRAIGFPPSMVLWRPEGMEPVINVDTALMQRVLEHLLANVRNHTEGSCQIEVCTDEDQVVIEIADRGPGMPSRCGEATGKGDGLRYCEAVLAAHGGGGEVEPRPGGGLLARTRWPNLVALRPVALPVADTPIQPESLNVWLVDDEAIIRNATGRLLRHNGHFVRTFERGVSLLTALNESNVVLPDLVLADAEMPGLGGLDVLRRVRALAPDAARALYTAHPPNAAIIDAFNQGTMHRYIQKDEGPAVLEDCVRAIAESRRVRAPTHATPAPDSLRAELEALLAEGLVTLHLQPIFDARTRGLIACEALMRSLHPAFRGPLEILDAARAYDRELALQRVLAKIAAGVRDRLPDDVLLFVNVDPAVLRAPRELDNAMSPLFPAADRVIVELTERARLGSDRAWEDAVQRLRDKGFRIALDDVGAGYNSLGAVAAVRPEVIKLDISLISGVHRDPRKAEMVRLLCDYARRHDISTVAEGIEEAEEADFVTDLGVRWLQGYHLGRPAPLEQLAAHLPLALSA